MGDLITCNGKAAVSGPSKSCEDSGSLDEDDSVGRVSARFSCGNLSPLLPPPPQLLWHVGPLAAGLGVRGMGGGATVAEEEGLLQLTAVSGGPDVNMDFLGGEVEVDHVEADEDPPELRLEVAEVDVGEVGGIDSHSEGCLLRCLTNNGGPRFC